MDLEKGGKDGSPIKSGMTRKKKLLFSAVTFTITWI
jgi:hypothetical protein